MREERGREKEERRKRERGEEEKRRERCVGTSRWCQSVW